MKTVLGNSVVWAWVTMLPAVAGPLFAQDHAEVSASANKPVRDVIIGPDDTVDIVALYCEEVSKTWRVGSSGELNLPMAGSIKAAGMTVNQLQNAIADRLKKYIKDPQVTVHLNELRSQPIQITGAVDKPGMYQLSGDKSLFEAILMAGGPKAAGPNVSIRRRAGLEPLDPQGVKTYENDGYQFAELDLNEVMSGRGDHATLPVLPNDLISVSPAPPQKFVYISGEVMHPGAVELVTEKTVSLQRILASAGGKAPDANLGKVSITHTSPDGTASQPFFVDLKPILEGKRADLQLMAGDVVVIPTSGLKSLAHAATSATMSSGVSSAVLILARF